MTPEAKRLALHHLLEDSSKTLVIPGAFNAICAKFVQKHGFPCTYVSGSGTAGGVLGLPDLGLVTLTEATTEAGYIADAVDIPTIADADTGFGELLHIPRTIHAFESRGLAGIHLEDQVFPKRCGHLSGKDLIPESEMVAKIQAAISARTDPHFLIIARTDAFGVTSWEDTVHRAKAYADAGADMIFPEALQDLSSFEKMVKAVPVPILANMTEFGKTPYFSVSQFAQVGCRCVLFPLTLFRAAMHSIDQTLTQLTEHGTQKSFLDQLHDRSAFYSLINYYAYEDQLKKA